MEKFLAKLLVFNGVIIMIWGFVVAIVAIGILVLGLSGGLK